MQISIQIPDNIAKTLRMDPSDLSQAALEALAIEGYRQNLLSENQISQMLGMRGRMDVHAFLKQHRVPLNYSLEDLKQDIASLGEVEERLSA